MTESRLRVYFLKVSFWVTWVLLAGNKKKKKHPQRTQNQRAPLTGWFRKGPSCFHVTKWIPPVWFSSLSCLPLLLKKQEPHYTFWFSELSPLPASDWKPKSLLFNLTNSSSFNVDACSFGICEIVPTFPFSRLQALLCFYFNSSVGCSPWMMTGTLLYWYWLKPLTMAILAFTPHLCVPEAR